MLLYYAASGYAGYPVYVNQDNDILNESHLSSGCSLQSEMAVSVILKEYGYSQQLPQYHRSLNSH